MDKALREELIKQRRFDELLEHQQAAVAAEPEDSERRRELAWVLAALGRMPEAVEAQQEACRLRPDDERYRQLLAGYEAKLPPAEAPPASEVSEVFRRIHESNRWKGSESVSGPGSSMAATAAVREALPLILRAIGASSMLDAPCGDFGWMSNVELGVERYIGVDVVPELIDSARGRGGDGQEFKVADISTDQMPQVDLVLCRDCLVHLSEDSAFAAIANLRRSGSRFLLATTFYAHEQNAPGSNGGWRPINMQLPPFSFGRPLMLVPERPYDPAKAHSDKGLGLWELAGLPDSANGA